MSVWFVFLSQALIFLLPNAVHSYGTGAPCVAQHNLQPSLIFHGTTQNLLSNPPPYTFSVENEDGKPVKSYVVGKVYTIRITAKNHFRGFLIQPRVATKEKTLIGTLRGGEFIMEDSWESQGIQYQPCQPKTHDSITHTNNEKKTRLSVKWKTTQNVGPIQFYLTLVAEQSIFWEAWQPETGYLSSSEENKDTKAVDVVAKDAEPTTTTDGGKRKAKRPKTSSEDRSEGSDLRESAGSKETSTSKKQQTETPSVKTSPSSTEVISTKKPSPSDPCAENECKNGASCRVNGTSYSCNCADGYVGKFCQWQCPSYLCQNGGTCSIDQSSNYVCTCVEGFTGNHCEESKTKATKAPKTSTTVISSSEEITPSQSKKDKDTPKSTTVKSSKQSNKGSSNKSNSKEGDNFDPASLLRGGGNAPPPDDNQQSESAKNDKPSKSNSDHSPSKEIKAILKENGGNDTFDEVTTEEPIPTTTIAPINPVIEKLVSKLLDSNNAVYTNGLHDIKNPDPCEDHQCTNGGECIPDKNDKNGYICKCHGEYDGPFCQWDCPAYLCRNGGSCYIDETFNYLCTCQKGYVGPHCETKNFTEPESANATAILSSLKHLFSGDSSAEQLIDDTFNHTVEKFDTTILKELSSNHIDSKKRIRFIKAANLNKNATELINILVEPDYCANIYCYNDGSCLKNVTGKTGYCNCTEGWTGDNCDKKDFCYDNKCDHNSLCINGESNYTCQCKGEFAGRFCSIACPPTLCSNHGKCTYDENKYKCTCKPGYTGDRCQIEIDECEVKPCQNGGTCLDKLNGYECKCAEGFMGSKCHRPCQDVYQNHCSVWKREERCESAGKNGTNFFAANCALSCGLCVKLENTTSAATVLIPASLEPLDFLIGKWFVNSSDPKHFPFDYVKTTNGYYEELEISPGDVLLFGIPALNYSSLAIGNDNSTEVLARAGFLSYHQNGTNQNVTLMSVGNDGVTLMEEGELNSGNEIIMTARFVNVAPSVEQRIPVGIKRSLAISGVYLRESLERRYNDSTTDYYTKYYSKKTTLEVY